MTKVAADDVTVEIGSHNGDIWWIVTGYGGSKSIIPVRQSVGGIRRAKKRADRFAGVVREAIRLHCGGPPMTPEPALEAERGAERKLAVDAMADADEAWTKALDDGAHMSGTADELRLTSLLAFGGTHGVTIGWDGYLSPALAATPLSEGEAAAVGWLRVEAAHDRPDFPYPTAEARKVLALVDRLSSPLSEGEVMDHEGLIWKVEVVSPAGEFPRSYHLNPADRLVPSPPPGEPESEKP